MNEIIEKLVNAWYSEWIKTNDAYNDSFEDILNTMLPTYSFGFANNVWFILNEYN